MMEVVETRTVIAGQLGSKFLRSQKQNSKIRVWLGLIKSRDVKLNITMPIAQGRYGRCLPNSVCLYLMGRTDVKALVDLRRHTDLAPPEHRRLTSNEGESS